MGVKGEPAQHSSTRGWTAAWWLVLGVVGALLLIRLGEREFWSDEGVSALLARNILKYGLPRVDDGRNVVSFLGPGVDSNADGLWTWSPWLDPYLMASSFAAFGETLFASRLPFVLAGLCCLPIVWSLIFRRTGNQATAMMGMLALGLSETFLLHSRQARYYSLSMLGQAILLYGLQDVIDRRGRGKWLIALGGTMQFYCNYIISVANVLALVVIALWHWKQLRLRDLFWAALISGIAAAPWVLYARPWEQSFMVGSDASIPKLLAYIRECNFHFLPLMLLLWPLFWARPFRGRRKENDSSDVLLSSLPVFFPAFIAVLPYAPGLYLRYLVPLLPVAAVYLAEGLASTISNVKLRWAVFAVMVLTNVTAWTTALPFHYGHHLRIELADFIDEISHPYRDRTSAMIEFFRKNARDGETIHTRDPEFPLAFSTPLAIYFGPCRSLPPGQMPDWILPDTVTSVLRLTPVELTGEIANRYERIGVMVPDSYRGGSLPDPELREYRTAPTEKEFVVYRLKRDALK